MTMTQGNPAYGRTLDRTSELRFKRDYLPYQTYVDDLAIKFSQDQVLLKNVIQTAVMEYQGRIQQKLRYRLFKAAGNKRSQTLLNNLSKTDDSVAIIKILSANLVEGNEGRDSFKTILYSKLLNGFQDQNHLHAKRLICNVNLTEFFNKFLASLTKLHANINVELSVFANN
jgi:hypothetical protein